MAYVGTQEQQKRKGLHHTHIIITLADTPREPDDVNKIVCAEIPNKDINPKLFDIIIKNNIHGPCDTLNPNSPCMDDRGKKYCTKEFPKAFQNETSLTEYTYPKYRRRSPENGGNTAVKMVMVRGVPIVVDNSTVVPYNSYLSLKYECHINIELLVSVVGVKYIYKYITKGPDRCLIITCHLPGDQSVLFEEGDEQKVLAAGPPETKLTGFFKANKNHETSRDLLYTDFPGHFSWKAGEWKRKKRSMGEAIGRIPTITLRVMWHHQMAGSDHI